VTLDLQGVNNNDVRFELLDSKGALVTVWERKLTVPDPKLQLTLPSPLNAGLYFLHARFPKCYVGSDRTVKLMIVR
jgi:hypothetical protein